MITIIKFRQLEKRDFENTNKCITRAIRISNTKDYSPTIIDHMLQRHNDNEWISKAITDRFFLVAELNSKIIATGALKHNVILHMFVDPDFQLQGLGKKMLSKLEDYAKENGYKEVTCDPSLTAIDFYLKQGYEVTQDEEVEWLGERLRGITMKKVLIS